MKITANKLKNCLVGGFYAIKYTYEKIDLINVFPVPDNDTGKNILITLKEAAIYIKEKNYNSVHKCLDDFSEKVNISSQGNSGLIFSQIFNSLKIFLTQNSGISRIKNNLTKDIFLKYLIYLADNAYKMINKPQKGTIISIIAESKDEIITLQKNKEINFEKTLQCYLNICIKKLKKTTKELDILKQTQLIDSGGLGYVLFLKGFLYYLQNDLIVTKDKINKFLDDTFSLKPKLNKEIIQDKIKQKHGFCVNINCILRDEWQMISKTEIESELLKEQISSLIVYKENKFVKFHLHSFILEKLFLFINKITIIKKINLQEIDKQISSKTTIIEKENFNNINDKNKYLLISYLKKINNLDFDFLNNHNVSSYFIRKKKDLYFDKILHLCINNETYKNIIIFANNIKIYKKNKKLIKSLELIFPQKKFRLIKTLNFNQFFKCLAVFETNNNINDNYNLFLDNLKKDESFLVKIKNKESKVKLYHFLDNQISEKIVIFGNFIKNIFFSQFKTQLYSAINIFTNLHKNNFFLKKLISSAKEKNLEIITLNYKEEKDKILSFNFL